MTIDELEEFENYLTDYAMERENDLRFDKARWARSIRADVTAEIKSKKNDTDNTK